MFDHLQKNTVFTPIGVWLSLVERLLREQITAFRSVNFQNAENP